MRIELSVRDFKGEAVYFIRGRIHTGDSREGREFSMEDELDFTGIILKNDQKY